MEKLDREFHGYLSLTNIKDLFSDALNSFKTKPIQSKTKLVLPAVTAGQFCEDDVYKLLGNINGPIMELAFIE